MIGDLVLGLRVIRNEISGLAVGVLRVTSYVLRVTSYELPEKGVLVYGSGGPIEEPAG